MYTYITYTYMYACMYRTNIYYIMYIWTEYNIIFFYSLYKELGPRTKTKAVRAKTCYRPFITEEDSFTEAIIICVSVLKSF